MFGKRVWQMDASCPLDSEHEEEMREQTRKIKERYCRTGEEDSW